MIVESARVETPLGPVLLFSRDGALCALEFAEDEPRIRASIRSRFGDTTIEWAPDPAGAVTRLSAYFAGDTEAIEGIRVDPGGTPFQRKVWAVLREVPAGSTISYALLATAIGNPRAVRAVGLANGQNPVAIVIPCHRVIGSDGKLVGYGGGLDRKRWLIEHERRHAPAGAGAGGAQLSLPE